MDNLKKSVVSAVIVEIELMISTAEKERQKAIEESQYHKGAMESCYDTFKEEAQYLMAAQDLRIRDLSGTVSALKVLLSKPIIQKERIEPSALVEIEDADNGTRSTYLILSEGGGISCSIDGRSVFTISVTSPLARVLIGLRSGGDVELNVGTTKKYFTVVSVS
ncbi:MAG: hypothetical protein UY07_C0026G0008 [Parcubacteria group bacterium GW2011_GWA1_47_8]|nr:MAG: hypothetical protein UY07_C0026G0008 [Parcubacteria group bacterium GW2011_GWA1_47_8]